FGAGLVDLPVDPPGQAGQVGAVEAGRVGVEPVEQRPCLVVGEVAVGCPVEVRRVQRRGGDTDGEPFGAHAFGFGFELVHTVQAAAVPAAPATLPATSPLLV